LAEQFSLFAVDGLFFVTITLAAFPTGFWQSEETEGSQTLLSVTKIFGESLLPYWLKVFKTLVLPLAATEESAFSLAFFIRSSETSTFVGMPVAFERICRGFFFFLG
jgi:hypothetical protein